MIQIPAKEYSRLHKYLISVVAIIIVIMVVVSLLCATVIPLIVNHLYSSPYDYPNTKWIAEEIDLWFIFPEYEMAYGELIINDQLYDVYIDRIGRSLYLYIFSLKEDGNSVDIFRCYGKWNNEQQFELIIVDDFLELGYTNITLTRTNSDVIT